MKAENAGSTEHRMNQTPDGQDAGSIEQELSNMPDQKIRVNKII
jgi:hypothetical protein